MLSEDTLVTNFDKTQLTDLDASLVFTKHTKDIIADAILYNINGAYPFLCPVEKALH